MRKEKTQEQSHAEFQKACPLWAQAWMAATEKSPYMNGAHWRDLKKEKDEEKASALKSALIKAADAELPDLAQSWAQARKRSADSRGQINREKDEDGPNGWKTLMDEAKDQSEMMSWMIGEMGKAGLFSEWLSGVAKGLEGKAGGANAELMRSALMWAVDPRDRTGIAGKKEALEQLAAAPDFWTRPRKTEDLFFGRDDEDSLGHWVGELVKLMLGAKDTREAGLKALGRMIQFMDWDKKDKDQWVSVGWKSTQALKYGFTQVREGAEVVFNALSPCYWLGATREVSFDSKLGSWVFDRLCESAKKEGGAKSQIAQILLMEVWMTLDVKQIDRLDKVFPGISLGIENAVARRPVGWSLLANPIDEHGIGEALEGRSSGWVKKAMREANVPMKAKKYGEWARKDGSLKAFGKALARAHALRMEKELKKSLPMKKKGSKKKGPGAPRGKKRAFAL